MNILILSKMNNIKFINTGKKELCLVLADKELQGFFFDEEDCSLVGWYDDIHYESYKLPTEFKYGFVKPSNEISEEQAERIVDEAFNAYNEHTYKIYEDVVVSGCYVANALESFKSLLQTNECYSENPYPHPSDIEPTNRTHFDSITEQWQKAEQNVGNWIVLEVIK